MANSAAHLELNGGQDFVSLKKIKNVYLLKLYILISSSSINMDQLIMSKMPVLRISTWQRYDVTCSLTTSLQPTGR